MTSTTPTIHGENDPRFDGLRDAFAATFSAPTELGAALAITVEGRPVLDLWAGSTGPVSGGGREAPLQKKAVAARHARHRVLDHEGPRGDVRAPPGRPGP